jgi:hypothetical protein
LAWGRPQAVGVDCERFASHAYLEVSQLQVPLRHRRLPGAHVASQLLRLGARRLAFRLPADRQTTGTQPYIFPNLCLPRGDGGWVLGGDGGALCSSKLASSSWRHKPQTLKKGKHGQQPRPHPQRLRLPVNGRRPRRLLAAQLLHGQLHLGVDAPRDLGILRLLLAHQLLLQPARPLSRV